MRILFLLCVTMVLYSGSALASISTVFYPVDTIVTNQNRNPVSTDVAVLAGDLVVMVAATNKDQSTAPINFESSEQGSSFTILDASDSSFDVWLGYLEVATDGTYTFTADDYTDGGVTANVGLYVLSSSSNKIAVVSQARSDWSAVAPGATLDIAYPLNLTGGQIQGDIIVIGGGASRFGVLGSTYFDSIDVNGGDKRLAGIKALAAGTLSSEVTWSLTNADTTRNDNGSTLAVAFAEVAESSGQNVPVPTLSKWGLLALFMTLALAVIGHRRFF